MLDFNFGENQHLEPEILGGSKCLLQNFGKHEVLSVCRWLYSVGIIIPNIWKNKTCSKPQTNDVFYVLRGNIRVSTRVGCILAPSDVAVRGRIPPSASGCGRGLIWGLIGF